MKLFKRNPETLKKTTNLFSSLIETTQLGQNYLSTICKFQKNEIPYQRTPYEFYVVKVAFFTVCSNSLNF